MSKSGWHSKFPYRADNLIGCIDNKIERVIAWGGESAVGDLDPSEVKSEKSSYSWGVYL